MSSLRVKISFPKKSLTLYLQKILKKEEKKGIDTSSNPLLKGVLVINRFIDFFNFSVFVLVILACFRV